MGKEHRCAAVEADMKRYAFSAGISYEQVGSYEGWIIELGHEIRPIRFCPFCGEELGAIIEAERKET